MSVKKARERSRELIKNTQGVQSETRNDAGAIDAFVIPFPLNMCTAGITVPSSAHREAEQLMADVLACAWQ